MKKYLSQIQKKRQPFLEAGFNPEEFYEEGDYESNIDYVFGTGSKDLNTVLAWLEELTELEEQAIDLETTGIRPYIKDSRILTLAAGTYEQVYAFPIDHREARWTSRQRKTLLAAVRKYLEKSKTKVAHNLNFELEWICYHQKI